MQFKNKVAALILIFSLFCGFTFPNQTAMTQPSLSNDSEAVWTRICDSIYQEGPTLLGYSVVMHYDDSEDHDPKIFDDQYLDNGDPCVTVHALWSRYSAQPAISISGVIDKSYRLFRLYSFGFTVFEKQEPALRDVLAGKSFLYRLETEQTEEPEEIRYQCYMKTDTEWLAMDVYPIDHEKRTAFIGLMNGQPFYTLIPFEEYLAREDIRRALSDSPLDLTRTKAIALYNFYFIDGIALLFYDGQNEYIMCMKDEHFTASEDRMGYGLMASLVTPEEDFSYQLKKDTLYPVKDILEVAFRIRELEKIIFERYRSF